MAEKILMIALSPTMETGTIGSWIKNEGDSVETGEVLCEVETDKAAMDYEAVQEGTLLKILVPEGGSAAIGEPIGIIGEKGEDITELLEEAAAAPSAPAPVSPSEPAAAEPAATGPAGTAPSAPGGTVSKAAATGGEHVKSSPLARALADRYGIDIAAVNGSGPDGRVVKRDVEKAARRAGGAGAPGGVPAAAVGGTHGPAGEGLPPESRPISQKRRIIARRLSESKFQAPHYYLRASVEVDTLLAERSIANSLREGKISLNAFLIKLSAETLKGHPPLRTSWQEDSLLVYNRIDIGIAVAQEDGLITPVVRDCGNKGIAAIDAELRELIDRARKNKLTPDEYTGAVFTLSNLGGYDIEEFTAIINPPGSAILAVGTITREPRVTGSGGDERVEITSVMRCTLSCDHRVVDGAVGAAFLTDLKRNLEHPVMTLI